MAGTLRLTRERRLYRDRARAYKVIVDGQRVASIRQGRTIDIPLMPGEHVLRLAIDWTGSPELPVSVADGEVAAVSCAARGGVIAAIWLIIPSFWQHDNWVTVERRPPTA